ncbi:tripartite tricarboxylate transporter substrate binding protein [Roseicella sp. DB1501]|uniref:Bug family tripartite tricarboxylate transporter substrate binding protein n=1 Tax=Roseicella sp. DB1501 TaxID=2730925 RepID=UPI001491F6F4|nr:tripartite tricarboxylate transporter substrate-binding protein [Roseicella sp. DB1501]NOG70262.1 tripartite tricarboxylate transporter substrate binding protein [Roseicella sp. DB1501]
MPGHAARPTRRGLLALVGAAALIRPALAAPAAWPAERSVRYIVPVAPGGSQDIVARLFARQLADSLNQAFPVENLPGAGSNIGYEQAARQRPDGYTLLAGSDSLSINKALFPRLGFDVTGFAPVAQGVRVPQILVVRADSPVQEFGQFVDLARREPVAVGTPGNGSLAHLLGEQIQAAAEIRWTHAPYRGGALAVNDLLGGSLQGVLINIGAVTDHVRGGRLRGLFVSSGQRTVALPEVPTLAEAGLAGAEAVGWHGIVAPAGTDPAILSRLNAALIAGMRRPEVAERLAALGLEPAEGSPEELGRLIQADAGRWAEVIRRARIQPD